MIAQVRRLAAPVSLAVVLLLASGPGVWAGPPPDRGGGTVERLSALKVTPADIGSSGQGGPRWLSADPSQPREGGWWSRRTRTQKILFVSGLVVGAAGIAYTISNGSSHHSGSGGGGGGGGGGY